MRRFLWILLAVFVVAIGAPVAHADPVIFAVTGSVTDGSIISGTITIDTTVGDITAADVIFGAPASTTQTNVFFQAQNFFFVNGYGVDIRNTSNTIAFLFSIPDGGTLVGYAGGSTVQGNLFNLSTQTGYDVLTAFTLTDVPEINPSNAMAPLALLAGVILILRGRRKIPTP